MKFMDIFEWSMGKISMDICEVYMNCELLKDVGDFDNGTEFDKIYFDKTRMLLSFYKKEGDVDPVMEKRFILEN